MFYRTILKNLEDWAVKENRKPLILRGARQVGKTSVVQMFSKRFDQFIYLNLERIEDKSLFGYDLTFQNLVETIFFSRNKEKNNGKTLIFIDEIQNSPKAVSFLRYFNEDTPELYVIAAGSLLETLIDNSISFPVGRVEYLAMHPCSFEEYLSAAGEEQALEILRGDSIPDFAHEKLETLFRNYTMIGGMPEIVNNHVNNRDLVKLKPIYDSLITSYIDDVEKYSRNSTLPHVIRHIIISSFRFAGERIKFEGFGNSNYRSREVGEAFRTLEKTMLLQLVYPAINTRVPKDIKFRTPKLQMLDTGLVNHLAEIQGELLIKQSIADAFRGKIAEHITGQELTAGTTSVLSKLNYWLRDRRNSQAEVDFIFQYKDLILPLEVKSGSSGRLRSLHLFMEDAPHQWAVRFYSGKLRVENKVTPAGKKFNLLNMPFYLAGRLPNVLENIIR